MTGSLGPPVAGDPAGMRRLAAELRLDADMADIVAQGSQSKVDGMNFEGPAAERMRNEMRAWADTLRAHARELRALADTIARSAGHVEVAKADRARRERQLAEEEARKKATAGN